MKFRHPYDETTIIDNTEIQPELQDNNGPALLMPFICDKGIDGEVRTYSDLSKFLKEHGTPNFRKHGQAYLQAINWIKGGGVVRGMRITAEDATYSNIVILADVEIKSTQATNSEGQPIFVTPEGTETTESSGNTPKLEKSAKITLKAQALEDLKSKEKSHIVDKMKSLYKTNGSVTTVPLFAVLSKGKGSYGDVYRIRMTSNLVVDKETKYRNYYFELFENIGGLKRIEDPLTVSLFPQAMDAYKRSDFIDDIIKDNVYPVALHSFEESFDIITELLTPLVKSEDDLEFLPENIDYIFGLDRLGQKYPNVEIAIEGLNLSALEGVAMSGGSDGQFAMTNVDRQTKIHEMYKKAFLGEIDVNMFNKKKFPADMMMDANFPLEVKRTMETCADKREDCPLILDAGIQKTLSGAKAWRNSEMAVDNYRTRLYFQHFSTKDSFTGKEIQVTVPYLLSYMIPKHFVEVGNHKPMAGSNYPIKDIVIENSLKPVIIEPEDKNDFYDLRLNYIEEDVNYLIFGTQLTSQMKTSDLSNINNVDVLYEMKKVIENLVPRFRYEFTESDDDMANFNRTANQALQGFQDYKCKKVQTVISQTPREKERKILNTKIQIWFKSFNERNDVYMIIDKGF